MGPSYYVPHIQEGHMGGRYHITADYHLRGAKVLGADPQYLETYYGASVQDIMKRRCKTPGPMRIDRDLPYGRPANLSCDCWNLPSKSPSGACRPRRSPRSCSSLFEFCPMPRRSRSQHAYNVAFIGRTTNFDNSISKGGWPSKGNVSARSSVGAWPRS